jgi:site-specific recombinase XerD
VDNKASRIYNKWLDELMSQIESKRSIYIHEYTHHLDQMRYKGSSWDRDLKVLRGISAFAAAQNAELTASQTAKPCGGTSPTMPS